jgi:hypothetical protein
MNPHSYAHHMFYKGAKNIWWRKESFFNKCCWEKWLSACKKLKVDPCLSPYTSINSKWIKDLNNRPKTLKLVQERAENTLEAIGIGKDFLTKTPAAQQLRESTDKCDYIKLKSFCTTKEIVCKLKRPPTEWEKIFASYTLDKGLITRIYREFKTLNSQNQWTNKEMGMWTKQNFLKGRSPNGQKHMKKCSPSLAIKEMQIKTTLRFHLPYKNSCHQTTTKNKCWWGHGEKEPSYIAGGNVS